MSKHSSESTRLGAQGISGHLLVFFRDTTVASLAVLTPDWFPHQALYAEVTLIKLAPIQQLVNDCFLLRATAGLWYVAGIRGHREEVEVCTEAVECNEQNVQERVREVCSCGNLSAVPQKCISVQ